MKRFNWKRILSLVLVLTLVVGTLTWNKRAASAEGETVSHLTKVETETEDHIKLSKELMTLTVSDSEPMATATIKLTVNGANADITQQKTGKTDIIFVMDLSNSMDDDTNGDETDDSDLQRITVAKAAATAFAEGVLTDENKEDVRIGIASFGSFAHKDLDLSNDIDAVTEKIDSLVVGANETAYSRGKSMTQVGTGGTNLQAGIYQAEQMLASSQAVNKIIIILSDGQPTYSFDASKHDSTVVTAQPVELNDGTSIRLLTSFKYEKANILGGGSHYTYKYTEKNGYGQWQNYDEREYTITINPAYSKSGWYDGTTLKAEQDTNIYESEDHAKKVTSHKEGDEGWYYHKKNQKTPLKVIYHVAGEKITVKVADNGLPAISESYLAKNKQIAIYSIAYDVASNANALYVMQNVASKGKYYSATSGTATDTQDAIKDVLDAITERVKDSVAAAKGTKLEDVVPSYMKIDSVAGGDTTNATINNKEADTNGYGNKVVWNLNDLDKDSNLSLTISVKIDLNKMAEAYAAAHPNQYKDAQAVKEALTKADNDIWFDMNELVTLTYTKANGDPGYDDSISALEGKVPQKQFGAYTYTINYVDEDGETVADSVSSAAFAGETISISDCEAYTSDTTVYDHELGAAISAKRADKTEVTVSNNAFSMPAANVVVTVQYAHKLYKISFVDENGTTPIKVSSTDNENYREYRYGATVTKPADPTKGDDDYYTYQFAGWSPEVTTVTKDQTYKASYSHQDRLYTVIFQDEDGSEIKTITDLTFNKTYDVPANPTKKSSDTQTFPFAGWVRQGNKAPSLGTCDGDAVYKASYAPTTRLYTVYFYNVLLNEDGSSYNVIYETQSEKYEFEDDIVAPEVNPSRPANDTYTYTFKGWTPELGKVTTDDMTFYAEYTPVQIPYVVSFEYYGGSQTETYKFGADVTKPSDATVARTADETYTYKFEGWAEKREGVTKYTVEDVENTTVITKATKNVTYVAVYTPSYIPYFIKFVNGSTVLQGENLVYHWDDTVKYEGATPTKQPNETYTFSFSKWSPDYTDDMKVEDITFDENNTAIFTAEFTSIFIDYKIGFKDADGTPILVSKSEGEEAKAVNLYHYGETVTVPEDPTIADSTEWDNFFAGWSPEVTTVTQDQVYTATYGKKKQEYTVTFKQYDGYTKDTGKDDVIWTDSLEYGTTIVAPTQGIVIKPADETYTYDFNGKWTPTLSENATVVGDVTYVAVMDPTYIEYRIKFVNGNTVLQGGDEDDTYHWDETVKYVGGTPVKSDNEFTYTFIGWKNLNDENNKYSDDMNVSGVKFNQNNEAVFEAQFSREEIPYTVKFVVTDNGTETVVSDQTGHYGHEVTIPPTPTKEELRDAKGILIETYEFDGWYLDGVLVEDSDIVKTATNNITYTGKFKPVRAEYPVKFVVVDVDGTETTVSNETYKYGDQISLPKVGTKEENAVVISVKTVNGIVYQVTPWNPEPVMNCNGEATYKCKYIVKPDVLYAVTFEFKNGEADDVKSYTYGSEIVIPANPEKKNDETYTYKFSKWTPEFPVNDQNKAICVGKATYTAQYTPTFIEYEVRFVDENGTTPILVNGKEVNTYHYNVAVVQPADPEKKEDNTYTYTFAGWVNTAVSGTAVMAVPACTDNVTYQATYEPHFINYTVVFENEGQEVLRKGDYHYGDTITVADNQTKQYDDKYDYTFIGWAVKSENEAATYSAVDVVINPLTGENDPEVKVTKNIIYTAVYEATLRIFNVKFVDDNGSDLGQGYSSKVTWGKTVKADDLAAATSAANGAADMRAYDNHEFFFAGWQMKNEDGNLVPVAPAEVEIFTDTTFYASYREKLDFNINYHGKDASMYGKEGEVFFAQDSVKEGHSYDVIKNGPALDETPTTRFEFVGWSLKYTAPVVFPEYQEADAVEETVAVRRIMSLAGPIVEDVYENGCIVKIASVTGNIDLYPVFKSIEKTYKVTFVDYDGRVIAEKADYRYKQPAIGDKPANPNGWTTVSGYTTTTYTFKGWDVSDEELAAVTKDMVVTAVYNSGSTNNFPPIVPPVPTITPTPTVTPAPTATPTPTPVEEEIIPETPDTPQGPVEEPEEEIIPPQPETPQGAPEEEVDLDDIETPQGDLPKTGTTPTVVFFGIGAACIMLGSVMLKGIRRREEDM